MVLRWVYGITYHTRAWSNDDHNFHHKPRSFGENGAPCNPKTPGGVEMCGAPGQNDRAGHHWTPIILTWIGHYRVWQTCVHRVLIIMAAWIPSKSEQERTYNLESLTSGIHTCRNDPAWGRDATMWTSVWWMDGPSLWSWISRVIAARKEVTLEVLKSETDEL